MKAKIHHWGDVVLDRPCALVKEPDEPLEHLMAKAMYDYDGLAVAANQVGFSKQVFVYDMRDGEGPHVIYNPVLSDFQGTWEYQEGCLSVPGVSFNVQRHRKCTLRGKDCNWEDVVIDADFLLARMFQHEIDHLSGKIYLRYLDKDQHRDFLRHYYL